MPRFNLRQLILLLSVASVVFTLLSALYASHRVQHEMLVRNTLEANRVYARKLAETADNYIDALQHEMAYSATLMGRHWPQRQTLLAEAARLRGQANNYNSVLVIDAHGRVLANAPAGLGLVGRELTSRGTRLSLEQRKPLVTPPFTGATGRLVIMITHPIRDADGRYLGFVAGTIYLQERNLLQTILGQHYYQDGSYLYVVDRHGDILYHPDRERIGKPTPPTPITRQAMAGATGSLRAVNSRGVDMLAGFSAMRDTDWGIVSQRPARAALAELDRTVLRTLLYTLPLFLLALTGLWLFSRLIARPLWQLARRARGMDGPDSQQAIASVRAWYFEAAQLKKSILTGLALLDRKIRVLNRESTTDPLTGLVNRRGMQACLDDWTARRQPFAVLMLDIDHFKQVNDRWGHAKGDEVLRFFGELLQRSFRPDDVPCRSGGEEFTVLLPGMPPEQALAAATRLRERLADAPSPTGTPVTVSIGVAHWPATADDVGAVLERADAALYRAKEGGRDRVEVADTE